MKTQHNFSTTDEYLESVPQDRRRLLEKLRTQIRAIVPGAEECISYRMPAYRLGGVVIAGFAATAQGGSYYPFSGATLKGLADELRAYSQTKGALHFSAEHPLPAALVRKLINARVREAKEKARGEGAVSRPRKTPAAKRPAKKPPKR